MRNRDALSSEGDGFMLFIFLLFAFILVMALSDGCGGVQSDADVPTVSATVDAGHQQQNGGGGGGAPDYQGNGTAAGPIIVTPSDHCENSNCNGPDQVDRRPQLILNPATIIIHQESMP